MLLYLLFCKYLLNAVQAFFLHTLITAKDYHSHFTNGNLKFTDLNFKARQQINRRLKIRTQVVRLQSLHNYRPWGYKSMVFSLLSFLFFFKRVFPTPVSLIYSLVYSLILVSVWFYCLSLWKKSVCNLLLMLWGSNGSFYSSSPCPNTHTHISTQR